LGTEILADGNPKAREGVPEKARGFATQPTIFTITRISPATMVRMSGAGFHFCRQAPIKARTRRARTINVRGLMVDVLL